MSDPLIFLHIFSDRALIAMSRNRLHFQCFKKSLVENLGLYNLDYKISSDYDFILRYLHSTKVIIGYLPKTIIKMRVGGVSNKSIKNILKKSFEDYKIIKNNRAGGFFTLLLKNFRKISQFNL